MSHNNKQRAAAGAGGGGAPPPARIPGTMPAYVPWPGTVASVAGPPPTQPTYPQYVPPAPEWGGTEVLQTPSYMGAAPPSSLLGTKPGRRLMPKDLDFEERPQVAAAYSHEEYPKERAPKSMPEPGILGTLLPSVFGPNTGREGSRYPEPTVLRNVARAAQADPHGLLQARHVQQLATENAKRRANTVKKSLNSSWNPFSGKGGKRKRRRHTRRRKH